MLKTFLPLAAGAALLTLAAAASAAPQLSDMQMDGVTAGIALPAGLTSGAITIAQAAGTAVGELAADTQSSTTTQASTVGLPNQWLAYAAASQQAVAAGGIFFQAGAISQSVSMASLP
jgi:hypothetical protein